MLAAPRLRALSLATLLSLALGVTACDRRGRECDGLRRVTERAQVADAGAGLGDVAGSAERAVAEIDHLEPATPELARVRADYRASLAGLATAARDARASSIAIFTAMGPMAEGPAPDVDMGTEGATFQARLTTLATPCVEGMFAGLATLFEARDAGAAATRRGPPDCDTLNAIFLRLVHPGPGVSVAAHALACAVALDEARLADPAMAEAARGIASLLRRLEPALVRIRVPASEMLELGRRATAESSKLRDAQVQANLHADAVRQACPAR